MNTKVKDPVELEKPNDRSAELAELVKAQATAPGVIETAIPGLFVYRADGPASCTSSMYEPSLCFLIQGNKVIQLGDQQIVLGPLHYLTASVHLPVGFQIVNASPETPYLGAKIKFDPQEINDMLLSLSPTLTSAQVDSQCSEVCCGLMATTMDSQLQDALSRLLGLLGTPQDIPILAPMVRREIIYRALMSEIGPGMRRFVANDSRANRISMVIEILKQRFAEPLRVKDMAEIANMSESNFFSSFKQVTRMSPVQFQKKLRLYGARQIMLTEGLDAATASFRVGYESPSHFSREYRRLFGASPKADIAQLKEDPLNYQDDLAVS